MTLPSGHRIGNYEIQGPAGAGGMGEVYRAQDSRLNRTVAIKAIPAALAGSPERLTRFENEARLLASLNHPNIATIFGIEDASEKDTGGPYLILEFVEGDTLDHKLIQGAMSVSDTITLCTQIASGIEAAHEKGIIHRDLKPANIMINGSGLVKILDFGLAKDGARLDSGMDSAMAADSPTIAMPATQEGMVLGTAPYMSPEQARGRAIDKRVDVWAFGCIIMECLTGRPTFAGDTPSDIIAKILEREPDWNALPPAVPPRLLDILRRCLTKDVNQRPRDIGDLGRELQRVFHDSKTSQAIPAATDSPSLAVLYFENMAKDPENEYFCSGITEDILTDLSKIKGLKVASKNAVSRYRGGDVDISRVAQELGVSAVLEGSVRRAGDKIRITTQLINAADGFQIWGERFDRRLDDVFAVQDEIAAAIVDALRVSMSPSDAQEIRKDRPANVDAYDLYLKGREKYSLYGRESMNEAMALFQQAIDQDSNYALAWAGVADCYGQMLQYKWVEDRDEALKLGLEAAHKAIALDPKLAEAHKAEANLLARDGQWGEDARNALMRAIEANPRYTPALINLSVSYFVEGNVARSERLLRRVLEIDPRETFAMIWLSGILDLTGRPNESLTLSRRVIELADADFYLSFATMAEVSLLIRLGQMDAAKNIVAARETDSRLRPDNLLPLKAFIAMHEGRMEDAAEHLRQTPTRMWPNFFTQPLLVQVSLKLGVADKAVEMITEHTEDIYRGVAMRLQAEMHPLLDREPFKNEAKGLTLVWPLQAPMIDEARFALFEEVHIESGRTEGTGIFGERLR